MDSSEPLENLHLNYARIRWHWSGNGQASFYLRGEFDLPAGYTRDDLSRDLTLSLAIADATGSDSISFTQHGRLWRYYGLDGAGEGMDIRYARIHWLPHGVYFTVRGNLDLEGVNQDTDPPEATIGISLPVATPGLASELVGEETILFQTFRRLWRYRP